MNPDDPAAAQRIVTEFAEMVERHTEQGRRPGSMADLPYPKPTIRIAIRTCVGALAASGQLTEELRTFLEDAYASLADYLEEDLFRLLTEYREAAAALERDGRLAREKTDSPAWMVVSESGRLAGGIARAISAEAEQLRAEFRGWETVERVV